MQNTLISTPVLSSVNEAIAMAAPVAEAVVLRVLIRRRGNRSGRGLLLPGRALGIGTVLGVVVQETRLAALGGGDNVEELKVLVPVALAFH